MKKRKIDIKLQKNQTYFCFDNEAFRLLACQKKGVKFDDDTIDQFKKSWDRSYQTVKALMEHIGKLPAHKIMKTVSLNQARCLVIKLSKPLAEILQTLDNTRKEGERAKELIKNTDQEIEDFKNLGIKSFSLEVEDLKNPRTVCAHPDCVNKERKSGPSKSITYGICHDICYDTVTDISDCPTNNQRILKCAAFKGKPTCLVCGHDYKDHLRIFYRIKTVEKEFLSEESKKIILEKGSFKEKKEEFLKQTEKKTKDLEAEVKKIRNSAAAFAMFMKKFAIIPYNDAFGEYLNYLIRVEECQPEEVRDPKQIENLKKQKAEYEVELDALKKAVDIAQLDDINKITEAENINKIERELMDLPIAGEILRSMIGILIA